MSISLRSEETQKKYDEWKLDPANQGHCVLCGFEPVVKFTYWKIVPNTFPYDRFAAQHDTLLPLRHVVGEELRPEEKDELEEIKRTYVGDRYNMIIESTHRTMTIPSHFHLHLIVLKS